MNHPPVDLPQGVSWLAGPADPRLADYVGLTDVALRRKAEPELGVYIAESEKVIRRALTADHQMRSLLMAPRWLTGLCWLIAAVIIVLNVNLLSTVLLG